MPDCDGGRRLAASVGGRLTCVTAAEVRGLWVPPRPHDDDGSPIQQLTHVAVPGNSSRHSVPHMKLHWGTGPAPVSRNANEDHILNVLFHTAQCLARGDALAIWESAIHAGLTEPAVLQRVAWRRADASAIARVASALSDSGLETFFVHGMRRAGVDVVQQIWVDGHPLDGLIGDSLAIQLDGFAYHRGADRRRDLEADARLILRGYVVLRFDYEQILFNWDHVVDTVLTAMAQGAHRRRAFVAD
jgi:very-short-patch-repair endonuclease